jgi:hypothetical protein
MDVKGEQRSGKDPRADESATVELGRAVEAYASRNNTEMTRVVSEAIDCFLG